MNGFQTQFSVYIDGKKVKFLFIFRQQGTSYKYNYKEKAFNEIHASFWKIGYPY